MIDKMNDVVEYWFGTTEDGAHVEPQVFWFKSTPELDEEIRLKFLDLHDEALSGTFDGMVQTSNDYLAIIICSINCPATCSETHLALLPQMRMREFGPVKRLKMA